MSEQILNCFCSASKARSTAVLYRAYNSSYKYSLGKTWMQCAPISTAVKFSNPLNSQNTTLKSSQIGTVGKIVGFKRIHDIQKEIKKVRIHITHFNLFTGPFPRGMIRGCVVTFG